jgi:hypothetical protein
MPLTMRPTGLGGRDEAYKIWSGGWEIGEIHIVQGKPPAHRRYYWALRGIAFLEKPTGMRDEGRAPTVDEAKSQLETVWRQWLAWAGLQEK